MFVCVCVCACREELNDYDLRMIGSFMIFDGCVNGTYVCFVNLMLVMIIECLFFFQFYKAILFVG